MLELSIKNNLILFFVYTGSWWQNFIILIWPGRKKFYHEPYAFGKSVKDKIDELYLNRAKFRLVWKDINSCSKYYEKANINVINRLTKHQNRSVDYFLKFCFHKDLVNQVHIEFKKLIIEESLLSNKLYECFKKIYFYKSEFIFTKYFLSIFSLLIHFFLLALILCKEFIVKRNLVKNKKTINKKVMVDFNFGINFDKFDLNLPLHYDDGFLFRFDKSFKLNDLVLYNRFWDIKNISNKERFYNKKNIQIVGVRNRKSSITFKGIYNSLKHMQKYFWILNKELNFISSSKYHYACLIFFFKSIVTFWDLDSVNVKTYLSRIDYDHNHHAIGFVCKMLGIHFASITHSPGLGFVGMPIIGILSFDSHFCHAPIISEKFYPSWKKSFTNIYSVGVWRSDITYMLKLSKDSEKKRKEILAKFDCKFITILHSPPLDTCLVDKAISEDWIDALTKIINQNPNDLFVICERHSEINLVPIYKIWLSQILSLPNVVQHLSIFKNSTQSYNLLSISDLSMSPNYSDQFFESVANNIKAITYSTFVTDVNYIKDFFSSFIASNGSDLIKIYNRIRKNESNIDKTFKDIRQTLGHADGKSISRIAKKIHETNT